MFDSAWQFVNLFAVLIFAAFLAKGLALSRFAYWLRRGTVACIFAASVYLSTLDNKTQQVHDTPPLFIQVYLYVFLLGFIVSWRVTPIGITGGIACGKSTVSSALEGVGCHLIDADQVARLVQEPGQHAYHAIVSAFGADVLNEDGSINRTALGSKVFGGTESHKKALRQLNAIVHPAIASECLKQLLYHGLLRGRCVVYDAALMAESGTWAVCWPQVLNIHVKPEVQVSRLMHRNALTEQEARARVAVQASPERRQRIANATIDNSHGSIEQLQHSALQRVSTWF